MTDTISGIILAGGRARRMGGEDKGLIVLADRPLIEHVIKGFAPQVKDLIINANRNLDSYKEFGYPVVQDLEEGFQGPLAGIAAGMEYADSTYIVTMPCDSPFVEKDYVATLHSKLTDHEADICVAHDGERIQPVFCMIKKTLLTSLKDYLKKGERKIDRWFADQHCVDAYIAPESHCFLNINNPDDITLAESLMQAKHE